ncbi:hypothetical protein Fmac_010134 [Flemingia macrophylla]|uniref:Leucine-rich repeat domain, L domain-containing protein n=1 Tax=Flemingia macrophylla TaxID=520843 RepID=A0ABD1N2B4_9FABA
MTCISVFLLQNLVNLKEIDLRESIYLTDIPDLSKAKILELVNLYGCKSLHQLHPSISSLSKLKYLDLSYCSRIRSLDIRSKYLSRLYLYGYGNSCLTNISVASDELTNLDLDTMRKLECLNVNSRSLVDLSLDKCFSLKEISVVSEEITKLSLSDTVISSFSSISSLPKIRYLDLSDCKKIEKLDLHSKSLIELNLSGCSSLKEISMASEEVTELTLSDTAITSLPSSISSLPKLRYLDLSDCKQIEKLDLHSKSLIELDLSGCSSLKEISVASVELTKLSLSDTAITSFSCISSLPKLRYFNLRDCKEIKILDLHSKYLIDLDLSGCSSLKEISMASEKITELSLSNTAITSFSSISSLPNLRYLFLCDCKEIEILDLHSKSLIELDLNGCLSLKEISMIPEEITKLNLSECRNMVSLPELPCALHDLDAFNCISLEREITQRVVLQHMLQKSIPYLHQQQQHHPPKGVVRFVFPGDRVIDDCVFQIAKHSMSIHDFKMSHLSGFIYCFILKENIDYKMLVSIYQDGELLWDSEYTLFNRFPIFSTPISKHMGFWYHDISKFDRENEVYDDSRDVEIKFQLKGSFWGEKHDNILHGLHPLFGESDPHDAMRDIVAGVVARMILVLPVFLIVLLKEDREEPMAVYSCVSTLDADVSCGAFSFFLRSLPFGFNRRGDGKKKRWQWQLSARHPPPSTPLLQLQIADHLRSTYPDYHLTKQQTLFRFVHEALQADPPSAPESSGRNSTIAKKARTCEGAMRPCPLPPRKKLCRPPRTPFTRRRWSRSLT